jgi:hypothetical protein
MFELDPLTEAQLDRLIDKASNPISLAANIAAIQALRRFAVGRDIRFRRHRPLPLPKHDKVLHGLVRYVAADQHGPFFPIVEPRSPDQFTARSLGALASLHRPMCCHGDFRAARIGILLFKRPTQTTRSVELIFDSDLPSFSYEQVNAFVREIDEQHAAVYAKLVSEGAFSKKRPGDDDQPDFLKH